MRKSSVQAMVPAVEYEAPELTTVGVRFTQAILDPSRPGETGGGEEVLE